MRSKYIKQKSTQCQETVVGESTDKVKNCIATLLNTW